MSRIFDALQISKLEGASFDFPLVSSLPAELPQLTEGGSSDLIPDNIAQFPSIATSVSASNRLVGLTDKTSLAAEKFRFLGVRLRQLRQTRPLKKVLITSTIPEEGKSMISANLAISLAQRRQQKVLLLEGDLRRPSLMPRFGVRKLPGLSEWLQSGNTSITNIYHLEGAGLWLLPAGSPPENPLELMQSERLSELMEQLASWFDWIIIDSPPVVPLADTSVWMRSADGVLVVTREGTTRKRQLQRGLHAVEQSKLLGVVLNSSSNNDHDNYYQNYVPPPVKSSVKVRIQKQSVV